MLVRLMGGKCEECGYRKSVAALHVHHTDPSKKTRKFNARSWSKKDIRDPKFWEELQTCRLLCANCHSEEHERLNNDRLYGTSTEALDEGAAEGYPGVGSAEPTEKSVVRPICTGV